MCRSLLLLPSWRGLHGTPPLDQHCRSGSIVVSQLLHPEVPAEFGLQHVRQKKRTTQETQTALTAASAADPKKCCNNNFAAVSRISGCAGEEAQDFRKHEWACMWERTLKRRLMGDRHEVRVSPILVIRALAARRLCMNLIGLLVAAPGATRTAIKQYSMASQRRHLLLL